MILVLLFPEREIDGEALNREDIATIFPAPKQFVLASKLYKVVQQACSFLNSSDTSPINTNDLLSDLDETLSRSSKMCASITSSDCCRKQSSSQSSHNHSSPESESSFLHGIK